MLLLGYNPTATLSRAPILTFDAIFIHVNLIWGLGPFRGVIATPVFHRWHHSRNRKAWDKNFASLQPLWCLLFGICEPMPKDYRGQL